MKALLQLLMVEVQSLIQHVLVGGVQLVIGDVFHPRFFNVHVEVILGHVIILDDRRVLIVQSVGLRVDLDLIVELVYGVPDGGVSARLQDWLERLSYSKFSAG